MSDKAETGSPNAGPQRCGFIAVIGAPNAGKSTLVNALVGAKVSIVSHKVQTTRVPVRGIAVEGDSQLVFIDTPGLFAPRRRLDQAMVEAAWGGAKDADLVVLVVDAAKGIDEDVERILARLKEARTPLLAVLNKVDRVAAKEKLLALADALRAAAPFAAVYMISALTGDGVAELKRDLAARMPRRSLALSGRGPLGCAAAARSPPRSRARRSSTGCTTSCPMPRRWRRPRGRSVRTTLGAHRADDLRDTRRARRPSCSARAARRSSRSRPRPAWSSPRSSSGPVHLFLFVKVREGWQDDPERYREMGLELPKK